MISATTIEQPSTVTMSMIGRKGGWTFSEHACASDSRIPSALKPEAGTKPSSSERPSSRRPPAPLAKALRVSGTDFGKAPTALLTSMVAVSVPIVRSCATSASMSIVPPDRHSTHLST